jgi:hypothetical protein
MRNRVVIIVVLVVFALVGCILPRFVRTSNAVSHPQSRKKQTKRGTTRRRSTNRPPAGLDYSTFSHRSDKHRSLACGKCHLAPTVNWQTASGFPDVSDFPTHSACSGCHRSQFFKGARPDICSICHTKVSPRGKERFAFEKPTQPSQFGIVFPHDRHQDVIALDRSEIRGDAAHARFLTRFILDNPQLYNNCTICHVTEKGTPMPSGGFQDAFQPPAGTFKTAPTGHDSCFSCHWKNQAPTQRDCAGCHSLSTTDRPNLFAPIRISFKFTHSREQHEGECTVCHINITREKSVVGLKPDVPITSCADASCHGASLKPDKVTIETELEKRKPDPGFVCSKCHTSDKGKLAMPSSHSAALQQ